MEDGLKRLGASAREARTEDGPGWVVRKGSAAVTLRLVGDDPDTALVQVASPVLRAPPERAGLRERLLRLNHEMGGLAAYLLTPRDEVVLATARPVRGLNGEEVAAMVAVVAHFSDLHDDRLLDEFGQDLAIPRDA